MTDKTIFNFSKLRAKFGAKELFLVGVVLLIFIAVRFYFWEIPEETPIETPIKNSATVTESYKIRHVPYKIYSTPSYAAPSGLIENLRRQNLWIDLRTPAENTQLSVPAIAYAAMPSILTEINRPWQLKNSFMSMLLPIVLIANAEIEQERKFIIAMRRKATYTAAEEQTLKKLLMRYKCDDLECLSVRVRSLPVSLALAQAAIESGWGTSRIAREANALYGQWTHASVRESIRSEKKRGEQVVHLRSYEDLPASVRSYMLNLNTHGAYLDFRRLRLLYLKGELTLEELVKTLENYAEKENYALLVMDIIDSNNLRTLSTATLLGYTE